MDKTNNLEIFAREVGHGSTRAAVSFGKLFYGDSWPSHVFYDHDVSGVNVDNVAKLAHSVISTNELATKLYNIPGFFRFVRSMPLGSDLKKWTESVSRECNPVILCHESLVHALSSVGSPQPKFLYTLNVILKPGEQNLSGLDGIIVRSQQAKQNLLGRGHSDEKIHVATLVDPDIVNNRDYDFQRRSARLELCQQMKQMQDLRLLQDDSVLEERHRGRFTVALITSGSGHYSRQIREIIQSFHLPLSMNLVNLVLVGGYDIPNSPMKVVLDETRRLGLKTVVTEEYAREVEGLQIVYNRNTKRLVDSSFKVIRNADVVLLTSSTDIMGVTDAAACPKYVGIYRGFHEKADKIDALRTSDGQLAYDWFDSTAARLNQTWDRIFQNATGNLQGEHTLYQLTRALHELKGITPFESNLGIKSFIERCLEKHDK